MTSPQPVRESRAAAPVTTPRWHTSAPAVFALALGLCALLLAVLPELAALAVVLALVALVCGVIGMTQGTRPGMTGRGVAIAGIVLAGAALLVGSPTVAGADWFLRSPRVLHLEDAS